MRGSDMTDEDFMGRRLGPAHELVVMRRLGKGGGGAVWLGWDEKNQRSVALKFLSAEYAADSRHRERFIREGRRFGALRHPNIVRVYGLSQEGTHLYLVCEFVNGRTLHQLLKNEGQLKVRRALEITLAVAQGLAEAHAHGFVHRDLKPENVMVRSEDGRIKILDFGIAKDLNATDDLTQLGHYLGTPAYSAPEQVRGRIVDARADIFSLGVMLYELLSGRTAFEGRESSDVLNATLNEQPIPLIKLNRDVNTPMAALIERMIEKEPRKRIADMKTVVCELESMLAAMGPEMSPAEETRVRTDLRGFFRE